MNMNPSIHTSAQARVQRAEAELAVAETHLQHSVRPWRERVAAHRAQSIVLAGFATGMALALLPTRWWGRIGAAVGTLTAAAARSLITPAFVGAAVTKMRANLRRRAIRTRTEKAHAPCPRALPWSCKTPAKLIDKLSIFQLLTR